MSFARISTLALALALAAGLTVPASAATVDGTFILTVTSNAKVSLKDDERNPITAVSGTGSASTLNNLPLGPIAVADPFTLSNDAFVASATTGTAGEAFFAINYTFVLETGAVDGILSFNGAADLVLEAFGFLDVATFNASLSVVEQDAEGALVPVVGSVGSAQRSVQGDTLDEVFEVGLGSFSVERDNFYSAKFTLTGSAATQPIGIINPELPVIPLPASAALLPLGLLALGGLRRRKTG